MALNDSAIRIKDALTMEEVARHYGFEIQRGGFISCPFHGGDHTPSLKIYPGNRGWYCHGCHKGGDVISFVRELYSLDFKQAVIRIDNDFGLGLTGVVSSPGKSEELERRRRELEEKKEHEKAYNTVWQKSVELTAQIDHMADEIQELIAKRDSADRWLEEHYAWSGKG